MRYSSSIWFGTNVRTHLLLWILHSYFDAISGIVIHFSLHPSDQSNIPPPPPPSPAFYVPSIDDGSFMVVPHQYNTRQPFPPSVGRSRRPLQSVGRGGRSASHSRLRSRPSSDRARADDDSPTLIATLPPRAHHAMDDVDTPNDFETRLTPPSSRVVAHPGRQCMYCSPIPRVEYLTSSQSLTWSMEQIYTDEPPV